MKTNLGKKSLLVLITSVSVLTACNNPSNGNRAIASSLEPQVEDTTSFQSQSDSAIASSPEPPVEYISSYQSQGDSATTISSLELQTEDTSYKESRVPLILRAIFSDKFRVLRILILLVFLSRHLLKSSPNADR